MAYRQVQFAENEWFHCYTRSIDRRTVFKDRYDYGRFLESLYLCNDANKKMRSFLYRPSLERLLSLPRGEPLVSIGAYCLMPNHYHILLRQQSEGGITKFMQKLGTSYSMYFNERYERVGNVFIRPFRAKHVGKDDYFQQVVRYVHLNPAEIYEPQWKEGVVRDRKTLSQKLAAYPYSSLPEYLGRKRIENSIVDLSTGALLERPVTLLNLIDEAASYYREIKL